MRGTKGDDAADILLNPLVAGDSAERSGEPAPGRVADESHPPPGGRCGPEHPSGLDHLQQDAIRPLRVGSERGLITG